MSVEDRRDEKAKRLERIREGQSVLDTVLEASRRMQQRVSRLDRQKLDEYFTSVRDAERKFREIRRMAEPTESACGRFSKLLVLTSASRLTTMHES